MGPDGPFGRHGGGGSSARGHVGVQEPARRILELMDRRRAGQGGDGGEDAVDVHGGASPSAGSRTKTAASKRTGSAARAARTQRAKKQMRSPPPPPKRPGVQVTRRFHWLETNLPRRPHTAMSGERAARGDADGGWSRAPSPAPRPASAASQRHPHPPQRRTSPHARPHSAMADTRYGGRGRGGARGLFNTDADADDSYNDRERGGRRVGACDGFGGRVEGAVEDEEEGVDAPHPLGSALPHYIPAPPSPESQWWRYAGQQQQQQHHPTSPRAPEQLAPASPSPGATPAATHQPCCNTPKTSPCWSGGRGGAPPVVAVPAPRPALGDDDDDDADGTHGAPLQPPRSAATPTPCPPIPDDPATPGRWSSASEAASGGGGAAMRNPARPTNVLAEHDAVVFTTQSLRHAAGHARRSDREPTAPAAGRKKLPPQQRRTPQPPRRRTPSGQVAARGRSGSGAAAKAPTASQRRSQSGNGGRGAVPFVPSAAARSRTPHRLEGAHVRGCRLVDAARREARRRRGVCNRLARESRMALLRRYFYKFELWLQYLGGHKKYEEGDDGPHYGCAHRKWHRQHPPGSDLKACVDRVLSKTAGLMLMYETVLENYSASHSDDAQFRSFYRLNPSQMPKKYPQNLTTMLEFCLGISYRSSDPASMPPLYGNPLEPALQPEFIKQVLLAEDTPLKRSSDAKHIRRARKQNARARADKAAEVRRCNDIFRRRMTQWVCESRSASRPNSAASMRTGGNTSRTHTPAPTPPPFLPGALLARKAAGGVRAASPSPTGGAASHHDADAASIASSNPDPVGNEAQVDSFCRAPRTFVWEQRIRRNLADAYIRKDLQRIAAGRDRGVLRRYYTAWLNSTFALIWRKHRMVLRVGRIAAAAMTLLARRCFATWRRLAPTGTNDTHTPALAPTPAPAPTPRAVVCESDAGVAEGGDNDDPHSVHAGIDGTSAVPPAMGECATALACLAATPFTPHARGVGSSGDGRCGSPGRYLAAVAALHASGAQVGGAVEATVDADAASVSASGSRASRSTVAPDTHTAAAVVHRVIRWLLALPAVRGLKYLPLACAEPEGEVDGSEPSLHRRERVQAATHAPSSACALETRDAADGDRKTTSATSTEMTGACEAAHAATAELLQWLAVEVVPRGIGRSGVAGPCRLLKPLCEGAGGAAAVAATPEAVLAWCARVPGAWECGVLRALCENTAEGAEGEDNGGAAPGMRSVDGVDLDRSPSVSTPASSRPPSDGGRASATTDGGSIELGSDVDITTLEDVRCLHMLLENPEILAHLAVVVESAQAIHARHGSRCSASGAGSAAESRRSSSSNGAASAHAPAPSPVREAPPPPSVDAAATPATAAAAACLALTVTTVAAIPAPAEEAAPVAEAHSRGGDDVGAVPSLPVPAASDATGTQQPQGPRGPGPVGEEPPPYEEPAVAGAAGDTPVVSDANSVVHDVDVSGGDAGPGESSPSPPSPAPPVFTALHLLQASSVGFAAVPRKMWEDPPIDLLVRAVPAGSLAAVQEYAAGTAADPAPSADAGECPTAARAREGHSSLSSSTSSSSSSCTPASSPVAASDTRSPPPPPANNDVDLNLGVDGPTAGDTVAGGGGDSAQLRTLFAHLGYLPGDLSGEGCGSGAAAALTGIRTLLTAAAATLRGMRDEGQPATRGAPSSPASGYGGGGGGGDMQSNVGTSRTGPKDSGGGGTLPKASPDAISQLSGSSTVSEGDSSAAAGAGHGRVSPRRGSEQLFKSVTVSLGDDGSGSTGATSAGGGAVRLRSETSRSVRVICDVGTDCERTRSEASSMATEGDMLRPMASQQLQMRFKSDASMKTSRVCAGRDMEDSRRERTFRNMREAMLQFDHVGGIPPISDAERVLLWFASRPECDPCKTLRAAAGDDLVDVGTPMTETTTATPTTAGRKMSLSVSVASTSPAAGGCTRGTPGVSVQAGSPGSTACQACAMLRAAGSPIHELSPGSSGGGGVSGSPNSRRQSTRSGGHIMCDRCTAAARRVSRTTTSTVTLSAPGETSPPRAMLAQSTNLSATLLSMAGTTSWDISSMSASQVYSQPHASSPLFLPTNLAA